MDFAHVCIHFSIHPIFKFLHKTNSRDVHSFLIQIMVLPNKKKIQRFYSISTSLSAMLGVLGALDFLFIV